MSIKKLWLVVVLSFALGFNSYAQTKLTIRDRVNEQPIANASVKAGKQRLLADSLGVVNINADSSITISAAGYQTLDTIIAHSAIIYLDRENKELENVTVSSTRIESSIENSPMKVEVLGREEMEEEAVIKPGNIASILGDVSGIQIQQSSAVSGNANVRIQGLEGKYTQILRDGMPLYEGFSGGFGVMTVPPLDLKQIELIKGSASTLFGGGAIAGLVNLISKRPVAKQEADVVVNYSTLKEFNADAYLSKRNQHTGYSLFTGFTKQGATDVNKDGLSDVAKTRSLLVHPRVYIYPKNATLIAGYSLTADDRTGGDMQVLDQKADNQHQYFQNDISTRHTGEIIFEQRLNHNKRLTFKSSLSDFNLRTATNTAINKGEQVNYFTELSLLIPVGHSTFVAGVNANGDKYHTIYPSTIPLQRIENNYVGAFAQYSWHLGDQTIIEPGVRVDHHDREGLFFLPRLAVFHRLNDAWALRFGYGQGYKIPNPLSPQIIDIEVADWANNAENIAAETSTGLNAEINYRYEWDDHHDVFINQAFFYTSIHDPALLLQNNLGQYYLQTGQSPKRTSGSDTYVQMNIEDWELYAGFTYTNSKEFLTPANRAAFTLVHEWEDAGWRFGLEGSYTGPQKRFDFTRTPGFLFIAAMMQKKFGEHFSVILNGENLLDYRMSKREKLFTGSITHPQFKPIWAPIDGIVINLSVRYHK